MAKKKRIMQSPSRQLISNTCNATALVYTLPYVGLGMLQPSYLLDRGLSRTERQREEEKETRLTARGHDLPTASGRMKAPVWRGFMPDIHVRRGEQAVGTLSVL